LKNVLQLKKQNKQHTCTVDCKILMKQNEQQRILKDLKKREE